MLLGIVHPSAENLDSNFALNAAGHWAPTPKPESRMIAMGEGGACVVRCFKDQTTRSDALTVCLLCCGRDRCVRVALYCMPFNSLFRVFAPCAFVFCLAKGEETAGGCAQPKGGHEAPKRGVVSAVVRFYVRSVFPFLALAPEP